MCSTMRTDRKKGNLNWIGISLHTGEKMSEPSGCRVLYMGGEEGQSGSESNTARVRKALAQWQKHFNYPPGGRPNIVK